MAGQPPINAYLATQVKTASKDQLLIMLFDGAIKFAHQARIGIEAKNIEVVSENSVKVQKILTELMGALDGDIIPDELYKNLLSLYTFCHKRMVSANLERSIEHIDEAIAILRQLRQVWKSAIESVLTEHGGKMPSDEEILLEAGIDPFKQRAVAQPDTVAEKIANATYNKPLRPDAQPVSSAEPTPAEALGGLKVQQGAFAANLYAQSAAGKKTQAQNIKPENGEAVPAQPEKTAPAAQKPAAIKPAAKDEKKAETASFFKPKINIQ